MLLSKPNTVTYKKSIFLLFINNRLVENDKLKKTCESVYNMFQPKGGYSQFVYMALSIRPDLIDVNVHPTKKQVIFERQDELCEALTELLEPKLQDIIANRNMEVDTVNKKQQQLITSSKQQEEQQGPDTYTHVKQKTYEARSAMVAIKKIRTDCKGTTLDKFFVSGNATLRKDIAKTASKNPKAVVP